MDGFRESCSRRKYDVWDLRAGGNPGNKKEYKRNDLTFVNIIIVIGTCLNAVRQQGRCDLLELN